MLPGFVVHAFLLYFMALVHSFHGTEYPSSLRNSIEFSQHSFLDKVGQRFQHITSLNEIICQCCSQFTIDDQLNGHSSSHTFFCWCGDGFIISVRMQAVAIVINGIQCLQGGTNIIEINFLRMQAATTGLNVIL